MTRQKETGTEIHTKSRLLQLESILNIVMCPLKIHIITDIKGKLRTSSHIQTGSLANTKISMAERDVLAGKAMEEFASYNPDVVVTSCPLCKKTFAKVNSVAVKDLAEVVVGAME